MSWISDMALSAAPRLLPTLLKGKVKPEIIYWLVEQLPEAVSVAKQYKGSSADPNQVLKDMIKKTRLSSAEVDDMLRIASNPTLRSVLDRVAPGSSSMLDQIKQGTKNDGFSQSAGKDLHRRR